jgi:hypothetical protein
MLPEITVREETPVAENLDGPHFQPATIQDVWEGDLDTIVGQINDSEQELTEGTPLLRHIQHFRPIDLRSQDLSENERLNIERIRGLCSDNLVTQMGGRIPVFAEMIREAVGYDFLRNPVQAHSNRYGADEKVISPTIDVILSMPENSESTEELARIRDAFSDLGHYFVQNGYESFIEYVRSEGFLEGLGLDINTINIIQRELIDAAENQEGNVFIRKGSDIIGAGFEQIEDRILAQKIAESNVGTDGIRNAFSERMALFEALSSEDPVRNVLTLLKTNNYVLSGASEIQLLESYMKGLNGFFDLRSNLKQALRESRKNSLNFKRALADGWVSPPGENPTSRFIYELSYELLREISTHQSVLPGSSELNRFHRMLIEEGVDASRAKSELDARIAGVGSVQSENLERFAGVWREFVMGWALLDESRKVTESKKTGKASLNKKLQSLVSGLLEPSPA